MALGVSQRQGRPDAAEKIAAIEALKTNGRRVLMLGDGLNDAAAVATAQLGRQKTS